MPFLAFPTEHFEQISTKKNAVGGREGYIFFVFHPTKTLLAVRLWNKKRKKEIFKQRHPYNTKSK